VGVCREELRGQADPIIELISSTSVAFSPDGKRLASTGSDNVVRVWDPMNGHEMLSYPGNSHFMPDRSLHLQLHEAFTGHLNSLRISVPSAIYSRSK
jgi:WD40 repeat protein